jgi:hypothetical protein
MIPNENTKELFLKEFYTKLLAKLEKIKSGEMSLDGYIEEVKAKIEKL